MSETESVETPSNAGDLPKLSVDELTDYIYKLAKVLLQAKKEDFAYFNNNNSKEILEQFSLNSNQSTIFLLKAVESQPDATESDNIKFIVSNELISTAEIISSIIFIKGRGPLTSNLPIDSQIHIANIPNTQSKDSNSFEILRSLVSLGISPYFEAIAHKASPDDTLALNRKKEDESESIISTRKKINELALSLQHLQQTIQVPDLRLTVHEEIRSAVQLSNQQDPQEKKEALDFVSDRLISDTVFLNSLQNIVNGWVRSVQNVTKLTHEPTDGSSIEEVNFWASMEAALNSIQDQLNSEEVQLTLGVLRKAKRFHATVSFVSDTGINESLATTIKYNQLLKELPMDEVVSASTFVRLEAAIILVFNHLKKLRVMQYPIERALLLTEAISSDIDRRLKDIINSSHLMLIDYEEFVASINEIHSVLEVCDQQIKDMTVLAREIQRKRSQKYIYVKINNATDLLNKKLDLVFQFRKDHQQLLDSIRNFDQIDESLVDFAYSSVSGLELGDTSPEANKQWTLAEKTYVVRSQKVESSIVSELRETLSKAKDSNEMFAVFEKFAILINRPSIKSSLQEFSNLLLDSVKNEIHNLQNYFGKQREVKDLSLMRDIPPVASAVIWAKQIESRLDFLTNRLELILGKNWAQYPEGQKIYAETKVFKKKLDTSELFQNWLLSVASSDLNIEGAIFKVTNANNGSLDIIVDFDESKISSFKEVRNLLWLGYNIPHTVISNARNMRKVYPLAISALESLDAYKQTLINLPQLEHFQTLLEVDRLAVDEQIRECFDGKWEYLSRAYDLQQVSATNLDDLVENRCLTSIIRFQEMVHELLHKTEIVKEIKTRLGVLFEELSHVKYSSNNFSTKISSIQTIVNEIILEGFANVDELVTLINAKLSSMLSERCSNELQLFSSAVNGTMEATSVISSFVVDSHHEVIFSDQMVSVSPVVEISKVKIITSLQTCLNVVQTQMKITSASFDVNIENAEPKLVFSNIGDILSAAVERCLVEIDNKVNEAKEYLSSWNQFQTLFEVQPEEMFEFLGNSITDWITILSDIKISRQAVDTIETEKRIGSIVVRYDKVQARVISQYDIWQRKCLSKFSELLSDQMKEVSSQIVGARRELEFPVDFASTSNILNLVINTNDIKSKVSIWSSRFEDYKKAKIALLTHRYRVAQVIPYEQLESDLASLCEILKKRQHELELQNDVIVARIESEAVRLEKGMVEIGKEWKDKKPISGLLNPVSAISTLDFLDSSISKLEREYLSLIKAAGYLNMNLSFSIEFDIKIQVSELKTVWSYIFDLSKSVRDLRDQEWDNVVPRVIRRDLDSLLTRARSMPSHVRQHSAFQETEVAIKRLLKLYPVVTDLKNGSLKSHHWKKLTPERISTLGQVFDVVVIGENLVRSVLTQANGEKTIEDTINGIKEKWSNTTLDIFSYQNKCRLVKGWDVLFDQCNDDLSAMGTMRNSAYFGVFESESVGLETQLSSFFTLISSWSSVQNEWIYLDGIFNDNTDIKRLLPSEAARFVNISTELFAVLKGIYRKTKVLEILMIEDVLSSIEKISDYLSKVKRSLNNYLEDCRSQFPRFYFLGNDDLLAFIGSSDITNIGPYIRKIFAGIHNVGISSDGASILSIVSEEGEKVSLKHPISLLKNPQLYEWLSCLESEVKQTLSSLVEESLTAFQNWLASTSESLFNWLRGFPYQVCILTVQIYFTRFVERSDGANVDSIVEYSNRILDLLAVTDSKFNDIIERKKIEALIIETVHHREIVQRFSNNIVNVQDFFWKSQQLYFYDSSNADRSTSLTIRQAGASFTYGFEYLGLPDKLVYTPLVDKCFLAMTNALKQRLGGSPFGPAGTGKTESIKALGNNLGKMVLVFCCDESFDFQSMGRIFVGLCKIGAWGCFDEFNRLEERMLSAVSSQIETIELGLTSSEKPVQILDKKFQVNPETGLFVTMNPGYAGRSTLPENLKKLFRSFSMEKPDREIIAEVILLSQGFSNASIISKIIIPFFLDLQNSVPERKHYEFGLRALKYTLANCGAILRKNPSRRSLSELEELSIVLRSICETIAPRLVEEDEPVMEKLKSVYFPNCVYETADLSELVGNLKKTSESEGLSINDTWLNKALQLHQIQENHHGIILVGSAGCGKTTIWRNLLKALSSIELMDSVVHVIDSKVMSKEQLFGSLDKYTRTWQDGIFTSLLREAQTSSKRNYIVFDSSIDPVWSENLNSLLDDNKLLTLPNGERLPLPDKTRILFEVDSLEYATPAIISRCGMVWLGDMHSSDAVLARYLHSLRITPLDSTEDRFFSDENIGSLMKVQEKYAELVKLIFADKKLDAILDKSRSLYHMISKGENSLNMFFILISSYCRKLLDYTMENPSFALEDFKDYVTKSVLLSLLWSFGGDSDIEGRRELGKYLSSLNSFTSLREFADSLDAYDISLPDCGFVSWSDRVPYTEIEPHMVNQPDIIIPTSDTIKHEDMIYSILREHKPLILCGPPGSGKTMTLFGALRKSPTLDVIGLNFSKQTSPEILMKTLEQYCEFKKTNFGTILTPKSSGKWLVVFCDEINLPAPDKYGTQSVISFLRQLIEQGGFWRPSDKSWVSIRNIQFVAACNSPDDPGRYELSSRFTRHACLIMVNYPGTDSLFQIYNTFNSAILKYSPSLRGFSKALTNAMIEVYTKSSKKFTFSVQPHYIYSPRELTRWARGILEVLKVSENFTLEELIRLWAHEAFRLFSDRLTTEEEKKWTENLILSSAEVYFPNTDLATALSGPILFSNWLSLKYSSVDKDELRSFVAERLRVFSEEEMDVSLILYDDLLEHVLRIDRVLRQPQGHLILVGSSTSGKVTLSKFVAWINGLKVVQMNVHRKYTLANYDETLRNLLVRSGVYGEKICFIVDESNIMDTGFIERMNTLLANSEIPGLFEGDDATALMNQCADQSKVQGLLLDTEEELYKWFTQQVSENLHVIFTSNDPQKSQSGSKIASPALFNRCVLNWMGDWSNDTLVQVADELLQEIPLEIANYVKPNSFESYASEVISSYREVIVDIAVFFHRTGGEGSKTTPGLFRRFILKFIQIFREKETELEDHQRHIASGLDKLRDTVLKVKQLKEDLSIQKERLRVKDEEARRMLKKMLVDQNEAERKQEFSVETQAALARQEKEIFKRREIVMKDLEAAEPAVLEAQRGVQNIKKQHLTEIRSMANPPTAVKVTMESVCILLGYDVSTWRDVQLIIRRDDFIASIVEYNNESQLTPDVRLYMERTYLSREDFNFAVVDRASKACGPLLQWVQAQLIYSSILEKIGPLRDEVYMLESESSNTKNQLIAIDEMIMELEESIEEYKDGYTQLIRDTENIKVEMKSIEAKVERSSKLLESLSSERSRWGESIHKFGSQRECLAGNSLLSAAFLSYCCAEDQEGRHEDLNIWRIKLNQAGIIFNDNFRVVNYIGSPDSILKWHEFGLPNDNLLIENFISINNSKYPFIIDPTGFTIDIIASSLLPQKLIVTSFLDDGFIKQLENALRFGGSILIQDGEYYDPIINRLLAEDFKRTGGRTLVELGKLEVDCSPSFKLYIHSKDPSVRITPFVESRTTVVNFTVTKSNLESKILDLTLRRERPEIEEKRVELMKLHSEYKVRLYNLEEQLLTSLSDSHGNILDNDQLVGVLENLKQESEEIELKMSETANVMVTIDEIIQEYRPLAVHCSKIFSILESLQKCNNLYSFSLDYFTRIFECVIDGCEEKSDRVITLIKQLYMEIFARTSISVLAKDKTSLGLSLAVAYYSATSDNASVFGQKLLEIISLDLPVERALSEMLSCLKLNDTSSEEKVSLETLDSIEASATSETYQIYKKVLRYSVDVENTSDSLMEEIGSLCSFLFSGVGSFSSYYDLQAATEQISRDNPIILCSSEGYDATMKVEKLAAELDRSLSVIALGSNEGIEIANTEISKAAKNNSWVLVQNVQMSPEWVSSLEKLLSSVSFSSNFRLFLTCTTGSYLPNTLIRRSTVLMFENLPGLKNSMVDYFGAYSKEELTKNPVERRVVYFLLSWFHSMVQQRLRFVPIGFQKNHDINDSDIDASLNLINEVFNKFPDRTNVNPNHIVWEELQYMIGEIIYGGKFDNRDDLAELVNLSKRIFTADSFKYGFNLIENSMTRETGETLLPPERTEIEDYHNWIKQLPDYESPTWYGLPADAESVMRIRECRAMALNALMILR